MSYDYMSGTFSPGDPLYTTGGSNSSPPVQEGGSSTPFSFGPAAMWFGGQGGFEAGKGRTDYGSGILGSSMGVLKGFSDIKNAKVNRNMGIDAFNFQRNLSTNNFNAQAQIYNQQLQKTAESRVLQRYRLANNGVVPAGQMDSLTAERNAAGAKEYIQPMAQPKDFEVKKSGGFLGKINPMNWF